MRISTNMLYASGTARMSELQSALLKTQQQVAANRRILSPSDDPVGAAAALELTQSQAINQQFADNRGVAKDALALEESVLQGVTTLLQDAKVLTVNAGNAVLDDTQRGFLATELRNRYEELLNLANSRDGTGNYLFAGFQTSTAPFASTTAGVRYNGDQGQRLLQVDSGRQIAVGDTGSRIFESAAGYKALRSASIGSGTISQPVVVDESLLTSHRYAISITGTNYQISNLDNNSTVTGAFVDGEPITFDGMQVTIQQGTGTNSFTIEPAKNQSIFATLENLITLLEKPVSNSDPASKTVFTSGLALAHGNLDNALDNVLTVRASVGSRLKELDSLDSAGADRGLQYAQRLSELQDVDYIKAITDLTKQQVALEAAQKSFMQISGLSLFNLI